MNGGGKTQVATRISTYQTGGPQHGLSLSNTSSSSRGLVKACALRTHTCPCGNSWRQGTHAQHCCVSSTAAKRPVQPCILCALHSTCTVDEGAQQLHLLPCLLPALQTHCQGQLSGSSVLRGGTESAFTTMLAARSERNACGPVSSTAQALSGTALLSVQPSPPAASTVVPRLLC